MSNAIALGNGNLLVNLDYSLNISDLYWPYVGEDNHLQFNVNDMFLYVDGVFSSLTDTSWKFEINYVNNSLVSLSIATNSDLGIRIVFHDCVDYKDDLFLREITLENLFDHQREIFFYNKQNFQISGADIGDTAVWYPVAETLVHYKKDVYIAAGSISGIYQFTCAGPLDNDGKGAYPDESGKLKFNPVTTGSSQSCVSYKITVPKYAKTTFDYFLACGHSFNDITLLTQALKAYPLKKRYLETNHYWITWAKKPSTSNLFSDMQLDHDLSELYTRSLLTIRTNIDNRGAVIAANDSTYLKKDGKDSYSYFWPRDGANTINVLIEAGYQELCEKFFEYCSQIITKQGFLLHKYYPNAKHGLASSWHPWIDSYWNLQLPIQEDETAAVVISAYNYFQKFKSPDFLQKYWKKLIFPALNFLDRYRYLAHSKNSSPIDFDFKNTGLPRPSYDLWEIHWGNHAYTIASVHRALVVGSYLAKEMQDAHLAEKLNATAEEIRSSFEKLFLDKKESRFISSIYCDPGEVNSTKDMRIDSSLHGLWQFEMYPVDDERIINTVKLIEERLTVNTSVGGIARYENDNYARIDKSLPGNPWFITVLWMAQFHIKSGNLEQAKKHMLWVLNHADKTGLLAEQASPHTGYALPMKPLTWSHAEFIKAIQLLVNENRHILTK